MHKRTDQEVRKQLISHLRGGEAFITLDTIMAKVPYAKAGIVPEGLPYSIYQQFFHLRLAQYDILEFSRNPGYESPIWPQEYWPPKPAPENNKAWQQLKQAFFKEREEFIAFIANPGHDLYTPLAHGNGQTPLREALLVIEHNAYHTGQLMILLRLLKLH